MKSAIPTDEELMREAIDWLWGQAKKAVDQGDLDGAERVYRKWMELIPTDPRPRYGLSTVLLSQGRYEEGWRLYEARADLPELGIIKPAYVARG